MSSDNFRKSDPTNDEKHRKLLTEMPAQRWKIIENMKAAQFSHLKKRN